MDTIALGHKINAARKEQGLTGEQLSERCNINATYLRQIEGGTKTPSLPVFVTICQQLHTSPHYLLAADLTEDDSAASLEQLMKSASPKQLALLGAMMESAVEFLNRE